MFEVLTEISSDTLEFKYNTSIFSLRSAAFKLWRRMVTLRFCTMTSDHLLTLRLFFTFTTKWSRDIHSAVFAQVSLTNLFEQLYKSCCNSVSTPTLNSEWTACANSFFLKHSTLLAISTFVTIKIRIEIPPSPPKKTDNFCSFYSFKFISFIQIKLVLHMNWNLRQNMIAEHLIWWGVIHRSVKS